MAFELEFIFPLLHIFAALTVIVALMLAFKLYLETDKGWYWLSLFLSTLFFAVSQWTAIAFPFVQSFAVIGILRQASEILATILLAVSCYGMYSAMKEIRKMVG